MHGKERGASLLGAVDDVLGKQRQPKHVDRSSWENEEIKIDKE